jgi:hypothetical protein
MRLPRLHGLCVAVCVSVPSLWDVGARAQHDPSIHGVRPEVHVGLGWHGGLGVGGSADIPIVPDGVLNGVQDELALRAGGELLFDDDDGPRDDDDIYVAALLAAQWNFYLTPEWSLFPELGLALVFGDHGRNDGVDLDIVLALGGRYHISGRNAFVLRLCHPFGVQLGFTL